MDQALNQWFIKTAIDILDESLLVTCPVCTRRFLPSRSDGRYCTHACKQKAFRERRKEKAKKK